MTPAPMSADERVRGISAIHVSFQVAAHMSNQAHQALHDALSLICRDYEAANPGRVMWVFGEGGQPPEGWSIWDDGASARGEWDMSILNIEIAEREAYDGER